MTDIIKNMNGDRKKILQYIANKYVNYNITEKDFLFKELYNFDDDSMINVSRKIIFDELKSTNYTKLTDDESSYIQSLLIYNNIIKDICSTMIRFINDNITSYKKKFYSLSKLKIIGQKDERMYLFEDDILTIYSPSNIGDIEIDFKNPKIIPILTKDIRFNSVNQKEIIKGLINNNIVSIVNNNNDNFSMNNLIKKIFANFVINYSFSAYNNYKIISDKYVNGEYNHDVYLREFNSINDKINTYIAVNLNMSKLSEEDNFSIQKASVKIIDNSIILDEIYDNNNVKFNLMTNKINDNNLFNYHIIINNVQFDIEKTNIDNNNNLVNIELINTNTNNNFLLNNKVVTNVLLRKKNINTIRDSYKTIGAKINISNENIKDSQKKIKNLEKIYNTKKNLMKAIDIRYYVNIAIYAIIAIIYLYLALFTVEKSLNIKIAFFIFIVIVILLVANYLLRVKVTERFTTSTSVGLGSMLETGSTTVPVVPTVPTVPTVQAVNTVQTVPTAPVVPTTYVVEQRALPAAIIDNSYISDIEMQKNILDTTVLSFINSGKYYLDNIDNIEIYSILYDSLIAENTKYAKYSKEYSNKKTSNEGTIEIIKHDIIKKSAFIVMISIFFLILSISYIIYLIYPSTLKLLYIISFTIMLINLVYFIIIIREPIRTKSRNSYWTKPASDTLTKANQ
jgi:hypothetical protein